MKKNYKLELKKFLELIKDVKGDILEIGTHTGNTTEMFCEFIIENNLDKKVYTVDTFKGYMEEDITSPILENNHKIEYDPIHNKRAKSHVSSKRWNNTSKSQVIDRLFKYKDILTVWEGDSKKVIPEFIQSKHLSQISLLFVDCNLYLPSINSIKDVYPLMPSKSIIAIDEHWLEFYKKHGGESKALFEFGESINNKPILYGKKPISPSYYIIKK